MKRKYLYILLIFSALQYGSCFNNDLFNAADSSLSDLDYTITLSTGSIDGDVLTLPPVRYNIDQNYIDTHPEQFADETDPKPYPRFFEPYQITVTFTNPNKDSFKVTDFFFEGSQSNQNYIYPDSWQGEFEVEGGGSNSTTIAFSPVDRSTITDTLVIKTDWSPERRYTVTGSGVEPGIFISPEGNDSTGDGSPALPFYTINKAMEQVFDGGIVRAAIGEYTYDTTQVVEKAGVDIFGSHSTDGTWKRNKDVRKSIIKNTSSDTNTKTIHFIGSQVTLDNEISGFEIHGTSQQVTNSFVIFLDGAGPALINNYIVGSHTSSNSQGIHTINNANPIIAFNIIYGTSSDSDKRTSNSSSAIMINQTAGNPSIILNQIYGGNATNEARGIHLNIVGAVADIYSNSIFSGTSTTGHTYGVSVEGTPGGDVFIVNNTIIAGFSLLQRKCFENNVTVIETQLFNNLFTAATGSAVNVIAISDTSANIDKIKNNFLDSNVLTNTYTGVNDLSFEGGNYANNYLASPGFTSYDHFEVTSSSDINLRTGGINLQTETPTTFYTPFWTVYLGGFVDLEGKVRSGSGITGYSAGAIEVD